MKHEEQVSRDVAAEEFERFADAMDLDVSTDGLDDEERKSLERLRGTVTDAIVSGRLIIDEAGQPVFTPTEGNTAPMTFREPTGAVMMAADQKKKGQDMAKLYTMIAAMTQQPPQRFATMKRRDLRVCEAIAILFLS